MKHIEVEAILEHLGIDRNAFSSWVSKLETGHKHGPDDDSLNSVQMTEEELRMLHQHG